MSEIAKLECQRFYQEGRQPVFVSANMRRVWVLTTGTLGSVAGFCDPSADCAHEARALRHPTKSVMLSRLRVALSKC